MRSETFLALLLALWFAAAPSESQAEEAAKREIQFNRDIRPILSENCFQCHGPDAAHREAELRLDVRASVIEKREHGAAILPGDAAGSQLLSRINSTDADLKMPPPESGRTITAAQTALLKQWIEQGAKYEAHWSLVVPQRLALPAVKNDAWPRNAIDRFVLAKLEQAGLQPSAEAPRETWLRRVTLDLTGLPPTLQEQRDFAADLSPQAYEKVVDRLLASEHFGERMAMHWLDLARYADTNGYNNDEERTQWPWRDWVIDAFNSNVPYDQFVVEQLAGDLLPNATVQQKIATAFNRNHVLTTEGGIIEEEYRVEYVADRVHTTSTVFLGLSLQCARCHDHKYDPITQQDYYRFFAFFNNVAEKMVGYNQARISEPLVKAPSRLQERQLQQWERQRAELEQHIAKRMTTVDDAVVKWERELAKPKGGEVKDDKASALTGLQLHLPLDETSGDKVMDSVTQKPLGAVRGNAKWVAGRVGGGLEFDGHTLVEVPGAGDFEHSDAFSVTAWVHPTSHEAIAVLSKMDEANAFRGYDLLLEQGKVVMHVIHHWPDNGLKVVAREPLALNKWQHVVMTYDGSAKGQGVKLYVDGREQGLDVASDKLSGTATIKTDKPLHVGRRTTSLPFRGTLDDVRMYGVRLSADDAAQLAQGKEVSGLAEILKTPAADRSAAQLDQLRRYYLETSDPEYRQWKGTLAELARNKAEFEKSFPATMVMAEMPQPRQAFLLKRGQYDQPGEQVTPGVPGSLPALPKDAPTNRLGLAQWLVDPAHPLTARVAVNRWWQMLFGAGLVETVEDFGAQGAWPTHPELLDHLAVEFSGGQPAWDVKALLKQIVLSATYRQSSHVSRALLERDPKNHLLARGPRFRLPAETLRDNALAISGLLSETIGGPSVKPYQPDGLWQDVSVERRAVYQRDKGADLYRRGMYTYWKRTCPPPGMTTFDAPDRETCTIRRARTNTPLQALVLMNDPTYLEAARKLAERALKEGGDTDATRLTHVFRLCVARDPRASESTVLLKVLAQAKQNFVAVPQSAEKLLAVGDAPRDPKLDVSELAAWTTLANVVLSLDETITKE
jgi:hypothetical protein